MIKKYDSLSDRRAEVLSFYTNFVDSGLSNSKLDSLSLYLDDNSFEAYDSNYPKLRFRSRVINVNGENSLHFDIISRRGQVRSPYLFAKELCVVAFKHFSEKFNITYIDGEWYPDSDNYSQFFNALEGNSVRNSDSLNRAASLTWTGKLAKGLGYGKVHKLRLPKSNSSPIYVLFSR